MALLKRISELPFRTIQTEKLFKAQLSFLRFVFRENENVQTHNGLIITSFKVIHLFD